MPEVNAFIFSASLQAKGTNSTSFLTRVRNDVELVPFACEDVLSGAKCLSYGLSIYLKACLVYAHMNHLSICCR